MLAELENVAEQMRDLRIQMEWGVGGGHRVRGSS